VPRVSLRGSITVFALLALFLPLGVQSSFAAVVPTPDCTLVGGTTCQVVFTENSSAYNWTVPSNVSSVHVVAIGGTGGAAGPDAESAGGTVTKALQMQFDASVTPGANLTIANGSGGSSSISSAGAAGGRNALGGYAGGSGTSQGSTGSSGGGGGGGAATVVSIGLSTYVVGGTGGAGGGSWNIPGSDGLATSTSSTANTSGGSGVVSTIDGGGGGGGGGGILGGQAGIAGCDHPPTPTTIYCAIAGVSAGGGSAGTSTTGAGISVTAISSSPGAAGRVVITYSASPLPSAPEITTFLTSNASVELHIKPPVSAGSSAISGYQYALTPNVWTNFSLASGDNIFVVKGLRNSTRYSITIRAKNTSGYGPSSNTVSASPTNSKPAAPRITSTTVGDRSLVVNYVDSTLFTSQSITSHEYSIDQGVSWIPLGQTPSPIVITGLTNGVTTSVQVRAVGTNGLGASSSRSSAMPGTTAGASSVTSIDTASSQLTINFVPPVDNGGRKITNFQYSTDGGSTWLTRSPASVKSPLVIKGLANGYAYDVTIRAVTALGTGVPTAIVSKNLEYGTAVLNLNLTQVTNGPTTFIKFANFTGARPNLFKQMSFEIAPKSGSTTNPVSATFSKSYLERNGYFNSQTGAVKLPIFGLYADYANSVRVRYYEGSLLAKDMTLQVTTGVWKDPFAPDSRYKNPEKIVPRNNAIALDYSYMMLKAVATGSSPVVIDTDGEVRWVGIRQAATQSSIFYDNGMFNGNGTSITRTELDGRYALVADYAATNGVTFLGHHNYDRGKDGILVEVNRSTEIEATILEINPVSGSVLRTFDLASIIENNMLAYGDNPSGFVRRGVDFFHNNSATYWPAQNTLVVSSRENFVIGIDYTTQQIKWILGDPTKLWHSYPSLRRYELKMTGSGVAPIGQHAVSITSDGQLMLFDNGKESLVQSPAGASRFDGVPRKYNIDLAAMTATETWSFIHNPVVHSPICSSIYQDGTSYLIDYASENLWQSDPLYVRITGIDANKNVAFEYRYPGNWDTGWNASPIHLDGLVFK